MKSLGNVSQTWHDLSNTNLLWRENTRCADFPLEIQPATHPQFAKQIGTMREPNWAAIYQINETLYTGWKTGKALSVKCHKQIVVNTIAITDTMVAVAGNGSISLWSTWDINVEANDVFSVGRKSVNNMLINGDKLIAACADGTLKVYN